MKKTIKTISILSVLVLFSISGCVGTRFWDGWAGRKVAVTVFDEESGNPISKAVVTLQQSDLPKSLLQKAKINAESGSDGVAELYAYFGGGGRKSLFTDEGVFGINGILKVTAEGYPPQIEDLSSLVGIDMVPIADKSAICVRVNLTKQ